MGRVATLFVLAAIALWAPPSAHAGEVSGGPPGSDRGLHRAEQAFGVPACGRPVIAYASFAERWVLSGADGARCRILVNADLAGDMPRAMVCTLVMHEWGHLTGRSHAEDPGSVMAAEYAGPDERCVSRRAAARRTSGSARRRASAGLRPGAAPSRR